MTADLLTKLAVNGLKNNKKAVISYILASAVTVMIFYIMTSIAYGPYLVKEGKALFYGAENIMFLLTVGSRIVAVIAVVFLLFGNQFVMRGRKKEMGLYGVLGLSKKNLTKVMLIDSLTQMISSLGLGLIVGAFLNKLMLLFLYKAVKQEPVNGFLFSPKALMETIILFVVAFMVCFIKNLFSVQLGNPIELLHSENMGEKEPKVKVLLLITGIEALLIGYFLALNVNGAYQAMKIIFISILLVIIGTYNLFTAGTIFLLKVLKKNKKLYYRTKNFISISNLMFRMKHNATGLASICVLSTGVILLLVCAFSLMTLGEQNINNMYPTDVLTYINKSFKEDPSVFINAQKKAAEESNIDVKDVVYRQYCPIMAIKGENGLHGMDMGNLDLTNLETVYLLTLKDFNEYTGESRALNKDEILVYSSEGKRTSGEQLELFYGDFKIKDLIKPDGLEYIYDSTMVLFEKEIIIVADEDVLLQIKEHVTSGEDENGQDMAVFLGMNLKKNLSDSQKATFKQCLQENIGEELEISYKEEEREFFYTLYGGIFFVGIFLAILFLVVTVVVIYYKQMSEGYEDRKRFEILANAGMTEAEAKKTIRSQVMILFFLPVCTAIVHMIVASKIVRQFLQMLVYVDPLTFGLSMAVICLVFFAVYALVYKLTSKQYYEIVYGK